MKLILIIIFGSLLLGTCSWPTIIKCDSRYKCISMFLSKIKNELPSIFYREKVVSKDTKKDFHATTGYGFYFQKNKQFFEIEALYKAKDSSVHTEEKYVKKVLYSELFPEKEFLEKFSVKKEMEKFEEIKKDNTVLNAKKKQIQNKVKQKVIDNHGKKSKNIIEQFHLGEKNSWNKKSQQTVISGQQKIQNNQKNQISNIKKIMPKKQNKNKPQLNTNGNIVFKEQNFKKINGEIFIFLFISPCLKCLEFYYRIVSTFQNLVINVLFIEPYRGIDTSYYYDKLPQNSLFYENLKNAELQFKKELEKKETQNKSLISKDLEKKKKKEKKDLKIEGKKAEEKKEESEEEKLKKQLIHRQLTEEYQLILQNKNQKMKNIHFYQIYGLTKEQQEFLDNFSKIIN